MESKCGNVVWVLLFSLKKRRRVLLDLFKSYAFCIAS